MFQDAKITNCTVILVLTYFTQSVIAACPDNCNSCDKQDSCTACKIGYWNLGSRCQLSCRADCLDKDCFSDSGFCIACKPGVYGSTCQRDCSLCAGGICGSLSCTNGCKAGYYEYQDTVDAFCLPCAPNCKSCSKTFVCNGCYDGFNLFKYISFERIKVDCLQCLDENDCSNSCSIQNCYQCQIQGDQGLDCTQCLDGYKYNGEVCISNESTCAQGCSTDCDQNRICKGSCKPGWTGEQCSDSCASPCLKCDKNNANICEECKGDYYTVMCDTGCDQSCIKEAGKQTCRHNDGYCLIGCKNKFWGQSCNQSCSDVCVDGEISRMCDRDDGTCTNGCVDGYIGDKCEISTKTPTATTETSAQCPNVENTDTKTGFITGYMSGVGTSVFVVVITTALYYLRRRYTANKSKPTNEGNASAAEISTYYNENASNTREPERVINEDNNYESLRNNRNTDKYYTELQCKTEQQGHSYYNMDETN